MGIKSAIIKTYARRVTRSTVHWSQHAIESQEKMMKLLVNKASLTQYGKEHNFHKIVTYYDFRHLIPVSSIADLQEHVQLIKNGGKDILWPGRPKYLLYPKNSNQYLIPVTKESLSGYFDGLKMLLFNQVDWIDKHKVFKGKVLFLGNPPLTTKFGGILTGDVNWIFSQKIPAWLKSSVIRAEMYEDESKLKNELIRTLGQDIRLIVATADLLSIFQTKILQQTKRSNLREVFPGLSTIVISNELDGISKIEPFDIEENIALLNLYISTIGCWAFQDRLNSEDVLLNVNSGLFFEFLTPEEDNSEIYKRHKISEVKEGITYKLIMSNNAGCWACDTDILVQFTDLKPFRLKVIS